MAFTGNNRKRGPFVGEGISRISFRSLKGERGGG